MGQGTNRVPKLRRIDDAAGQPRTIGLPDKDVQTTTVETADHNEGHAERRRASLSEHLHRAKHRKPGVGDHNVNAWTREESVAHVTAVAYVLCRCLRVRVRASVGARSGGSAPGPAGRV